jgi:hypothetical protein
MCNRQPRAKREAMTLCQSWLSVECGRRSGYLNANVSKLRWAWNETCVRPVMQWKTRNCTS